jgi:hypothetical protein
MKLRPKVTRVLMMGELGNQMFQLVFALSKSKLLNQSTELIFSSNPNRLTEFNLPLVSFVEPNRFGRIILGLRLKLVNWTVKTLVFFRLFPGIKIVEKLTNTVVEKVPHKFDQTLLDGRQGAIHYGYFQTWKYFASNENEIRKILKIKNESSEFKKLRELLAIEPFTAIHIRRGGVGPSIINAEFHGFASLHYYKNAIALLEKLGENLPLVVFTDNIEKANEIISALPVKPKMVISPSDLQSQSETLELMSSCHAFIGANSSYSWWAAFLGDQQGKTTIFPRPWYRSSGMPEQDLLAPNWITLGLEPKKFEQAESS